jgi:hypothetical protein
MISMRIEKCGHLAIAAAAMAACINLFRAVAAPVPIQVSSNGHYFVNARGEPFYFLADTQWELFRRYSLNDAKLILENRKAKGFTVVMVMLTGVGSGTNPNLEGQRPWLNQNPATPNPAYFTNVDAVVRLAEVNDIHLLIGLYHQTYGNRMTVENAKRGLPGSRAAIAISQTSCGQFTPRLLTVTKRSSQSSRRAFRKETRAGI